MADNVPHNVQATAAGDAVTTPNPPVIPGGASSDGEHYEEVAEYRVGEGAPPLALVILFACVVLWAMTSWVPFFGY